MLSSTHLEAQKFNRHDVDKSICIMYNGRNIKNVPPPFLNVLIIFPTRVLYLVCTIFSLICSISSSANFKRCFSFKNCEVSLTCLKFSFSLEHFPQNPYYARTRICAYCSLLFHELTKHSEYASVPSEHLQSPAYKSIPRDLLSTSEEPNLAFNTHCN